MTSWWVDANVLLRLLTADPEHLASRALELVRRAEQGELNLMVSQIVVAEVVWVLGRFYGHPKQEIATQVSALLLSDAFTVEDRDLVLTALNLMADRNVDFADALLAETARSRGDGVATFDADFKRLGAEILDGCLG